MIPTFAPATKCQLTPFLARLADAVQEPGPTITVSPEVAAALAAARFAAVVPYHLRATPSPARQIARSANVLGIAPNGVSSARRCSPARPRGGRGSRYWARESPSNSVRPRARTGRT